MKHYTSGFDYFTPDPGKYQSMQCKACDTEMDVERDVTISRSRFSFLVDRDLLKSRKVDKFTCPHTGEDWHNQAIQLRRFVQKTPSRVLASLVEEEIKTVVKWRRPTKKI